MPESDTAVAIASPSALDRLARIITELFAPALWAATMPLIVAMHSQAPAWASGLAWGLLAVLFSSVVPYGVIWLGVRRGQLTDHHIGVREQRRMPLVYGLLSVLLGLGVLWILGAPRPLVAMVAVMFAVLLTVTAINQIWKLSAHTAVSSGSAGVLIILFGAPLVLSFLLVTVIGWSRVRLSDHTASQVVTGAVVGILVAGPLFLAAT